MQITSVVGFGRIEPAWITRQADVGRWSTGVGEKQFVIRSCWRVLVDVDYEAISDIGSTICPQGAMNIEVR